MPPFVQSKYKLDINMRDEQTSNMTERFQNASRRDKKS